MDMAKVKQILKIKGGMCKINLVDKHLDIQWLRLNQGRGKIEDNWVIGNFKKIKELPQEMRDSINHP